MKTGKTRVRFADGRHRQPQLTPSNDHAADRLGPSNPRQEFRSFMPSTRLSRHELRVEVFHSNAFALSQALASTFHAPEEPGIMFKFIVEPIVLRAKSNQYAGRPAVPGDHDLFGFRQSQVLGQVVLNLRQSYLFHRSHRVAQAIGELRIWGRSPRPPPCAPSRRRRRERRLRCACDTEVGSTLAVAWSGSCSSSSVRAANGTRCRPEPRRGGAPPRHHSLQRLRERKGYRTAFWPNCSQNRWAGQFMKLRDAGIASSETNSPPPKRPVSHQLSAESSRVSASLAG